MKKGFTMIELIFVIVILGILASVAIPRLAGTRTDAEISATVANLRTLLNDVASYYAVKGEFGTVKWNEITNVPLENANRPAAAKGSQNDGILKVGGENCIDFLVNINDGTAPAYILIAKKGNGNNVSALCKQVQNSEPLKSYFNSKVTGVTLTNGGGVVAIGSSTSIYDKKTTTPQTSS